MSETSQTKKSYLESPQQWANRMLGKELQGKRLSRKVRDRVSAIMRETGRFSKKSSKKAEVKHDSQ
jgi:hypothetical protein